MAAQLELGQSYGCLGSASNTQISSQRDEKVNIACRKRSDIGKMLLNNNVFPE